MPISPHQLLWAKTDQSNGKLHRLIYHLIDVGQVTVALWNHALDFDTKRKFSAWLQLDSEQISRLLPFLAGLHDLGKASPIFQMKYPLILDELRSAGFSFPLEIPVQPAPHGVMSTWILRSLFQSELGLSRQDAGLIATALGGHHGSWPTPTQLGPTALKSADKGDGLWDTARLELFRSLKAVFLPPASFQLPTDQLLANALLTLFSGLTSVADWIGSMSEFFPYEMDSLPLEAYARRSANQAELALRELGWLGWHASGERLTFQQMFPFPPNTVQETVMDIANQIPQPALFILEAPTGSGKTEAALYAADTWLQTLQGHGIYIAMPTQATSNQMHDRVKHFLQARYPEQTLNVYLAHGAALLAGEKEPASSQGIYDDDQNKTEGGVRAGTWFLPRKRTLLAPFAVGTVDQALLSVLQTRHFFVRLFGLGSKVVVFDEIHAYDTYMSELFQRLLAWLRQIGASVILLSATLPETTRRQLAAAYLGEEKMNFPPTEYPRLTIASDRGVQSIPLATPSSRSVVLEWSPREDRTLVDCLREALVEGGCAAVICNRIQRALEVYAAVRDAELVSAEDLILFHARFPFKWREEIEKQVLSRFGKTAKRPAKSIVIATQVIEQSLDLDFDFMITDLAPVDLLIQRAGRLHRHNQNDANRPMRLKSPRLILATPNMVAGVPDFGRDVYVYDRSILLHTWLSLAGRSKIDLPADTTLLIEAVYSGQLVIPDERLRQALDWAERDAQKKEREVIFRAREKLIARPEDEDLLFNRNFSLEEEDPKVHEAFRALTRLVEPGVSLICLHRVAGQIHPDPEGVGTPLDLNRKPDLAMTRDLLRCAVSVQRKAIVDHFIAKGIHPPWEEVAALRYQFPVIFENGRCSLEGTSITLVLSRETGLEIQ